MQLEGTLRVGRAGGRWMRRRRTARNGTRRGPGRISRSILAVAILIGLGLPGAYYAYGLYALRDLASRYAHELAHRVAAVLREAPRPGGAPAIEIGTILGEFLAVPHQNVTSVQFLDGAGRPFPLPESAASSRRGWLRLPFLAGTAPIMLQRQTVGKIEVKATQENLLREAFAFFVLCAFAGISVVILMARPLKKRNRGRAGLALRRPSGLPPCIRPPRGPHVPPPLHQVPDSG